MLIVLALGFLWNFLIAVQTRLVTDAQRPNVLMAWAFITSTVWALLVRNVAVTSDVGVTLAYAVGSAIGWRVSLWIRIDKGAR